jgi:predicted phosphodiesterase
MNPSAHDETPSYAGFSDMDPAKNFFFLVGDTQATSHWEFWRERNDRERRLIIGEIAGRKPAFVVHLGDLTARGSSKKHWRQFDDLHAEWREKKIPCFPVLGNHEFYGNDTTALRYYFAHFPHLEQRRCYSFTWKNVGFIMVDSNFDTLSQEHLKKQAEWYLRELERFDKDERVDHVIACCHRSPFTNSRVVGPNRRSRTYFAEPFVRFRKTRFFFSGHSHTYERFQYEGRLFIVTGGGGGPRHKVTVDPGKQRYNDLFHGPALRFFHFCRIEVSGRALLYAVLRLEPAGQFAAVDQFTIPCG